MYRAPGQDAPCGHCRCNDCTITFEASLDFDGLVVPLKRTYRVGEYPGGARMQKELEQNWAGTYRELKEYHRLMQRPVGTGDEGRGISDGHHGHIRRR